MGDILKKLGLTPSRRMLEAQHLAAAAAIEVVESGGGAWDNREVGEGEIAAFLAGGSANAPSAPAAPTRPGAPQPPAEPPAAGGPSILVPVSFTFKVGRSYRYFEVEKIKVEGELKIAPEDDGGVVKSADVVGLAIEKGKVSVARKYEVDLRKLKELVLGEVEAASKDAKVQVDPKLEFKIGPEEVNIAIGISVACGWYVGSTKFVAVAKEAGKDFQFADVQVAPIGIQFKPPHPVDFNGIKGKVSGKLSVTVVLKPAWGTIAADVGQKIGRPVLTTIAEALTAEAVIAAGFVAAGAAQIFAYVKSVSEWQDVQACHAAAECGWLSFRAGFGAVYGLRWNDGGVAALRKSGADAATQLQQARLKASRERVLSERGRLPADFDADYMDVLKEQVAKNPDGLGLWVQKTFRRPIVDEFLRAYEAEHQDDYQFKPNYRALRTLLGVV